MSNFNNKQEGHVMSGAGGAAAAIRGKIIRAFGNANAFSEADALSVEGLGLRRKYRIFIIMVKRGKIIETSDGRFYMDRAYFDAHMRRKKIMLPIALTILFGCVLFLVIWAILTSR